MRHDQRDWRAVDRAKRADDWRYAGEFLVLAPLGFIGGLVATMFVGFFVSCVFIAAVLIRCAPLIIAVFVAIMLARCVGVV
jgi:hypothetical protein